MVSEAAEALIRLNLSLMVYSDLRTSDALSVIEDHSDRMRQDSELRSIYARYCDRLRGIVEATAVLEDNPKLVKLYDLLSRLYAKDVAKGTLHVDLIMGITPSLKKTSHVVFVYTFA